MYIPCSFCLLVFHNLVSITFWSWRLRRKKNMKHCKFTNGIEIHSCKLAIAMENPTCWWYLPVKMGIFMGYESLLDGTVVEWKANFSQLHPSRFTAGIWEVPPRLENIIWTKTRHVQVLYMGVSKKRGTPKWMVYNGRFGGTPIIGNIHMGVSLNGGTPISHPTMAHF